MFLKVVQYKTLHVKYLTKIEKETSYARKTKKNFKDYTFVCRQNFY